MSVSTKLCTALAATLLLGATACKESDRKAADKAAEKVVDGEHHHAVSAASDFEAKSAARVRGLELRVKVQADQQSLMTSVAEGMALTDASRADVNTRIETFKMRVEDARSAITTLGTSDATAFKDNDDAATKAVDRVDDARKDVWDAIKHDDHVEQPTT